jgi:hypothetical protein
MEDSGAAECTLSPPMPATTVFFLCPRANLLRERLGYARAFARRGIDVLCLDDAAGADRDLAAISAAGHTPALILHPDPWQPVLPAGLERSPVPTACFQIDSFVARDWRARWSRLFDRVFVFHAADVDAYRAAGNPDVVPLYHAAEPATAQLPGRPRDLDVAFIGNTRDLYRRRRVCLETLAPHVQINDWRRTYRPMEAAELYARARLVLNVGRDDFPEDIGVRFGEAMSAGAMIASIMPSEMTALGFIEGTDFVGFGGPADVVTICRRYLDDDAARVQIATAGQAKLLAGHTYDNRVATIMEGSRALQAPARGWSAAEVELTRFEYFAAKGLLRDAGNLLPAIARARPAAVLPALARLGRAGAGRLVSRIKSVRRARPGKPT